MSGFTYFSKKRMQERYIHAAASANLDGYLTPDQAIRAFRDFDKLWRDFTKQQKARFRAMRALEHNARGRGDPLPVHDYAGSAATDVQYWDMALDRVQRRIYDSALGR